MNLDAKKQNLIEQLAQYQSPGLFNPWSMRSSDDLEENAPMERRKRYLAHLCAPQVRYLLVGEAAGYQGCRYSGIPFTSERLLLEGAIPRIDILPGRLTSRPRPWSEPSATIVWSTLHRLGIADCTVLWNAIQWHPEGARGPHSNRPPTEEERKAGRYFLERCLALFPDAVVIAVGRKAEASLSEIPGINFQAVRHPANGGASRFREGLAEIVQRSA